MYKILMSLLLLGLVSIAHAQSAAQPQGFYFKTGGDGADQWYQVLATEPGQYAVTDIYGQGFTTDFGDGLANIINSNQISVAANAGTPAFSLSRTTGTDSSFPLTADRLFTASPLFSGNWDISELVLDPVTGAILQQGDGSFEFIDVFTLSASQQTVRFTDSLGTYFQGAMNGSDQVIFRRLRNIYVDIPTEGPYATIPGSTNNFSRDIVGIGTFTDVNHFEVLLALQQYSFFSLDQFLLKISGSRINPLVAGDVNGNRSINQDDRNLLVTAIGQVKDQDDGFNIAADLNHDGLIDYRDLAVFDGTQVTSENITSAMTATWFDPSHDGEGWDLQILNDQTAHLSWYTYNELGEQMWVTGLGNINGNEINFPDLAYVPVGSKFGAEFDPDEVVLSDWGSVNMYFETCNSASLTYSSRAGFGFGGVKPTRIFNHGGLDCINQSIDPSAISPFTGLWYDPSHDGEGWGIHVTDSGAALVSWYTYDENAKAAWVVGLGSIDQNALTITDLITTSGPIFGAEFDPDDVERTPWGSMTFTLDACHQGTLTYNAIRPELGSGTLKPVRLASVAELDCMD